VRGDQRIRAESWWLHEHGSGEVLTTASRYWSSPKPGLGRRCGETRVCVGNLVVRGLVREGRATASPARAAAWRLMQHSGRSYCFAPRAGTPQCCCVWAKAVTPPFGLIVCCSRRDGSSASARPCLLEGRRAANTEAGSHLGLSGAAGSRSPAVRMLVLVRGGSPICPPAHGGGCRTNKTRCTHRTTAGLADLVRTAQAARAGPHRPKWFTPES
jgi:hypothetical protein